MNSLYPLEISKRPRSRDQVSKSGKKKKKSKNLKSKPKVQTAKVFKDFCESTSLHGYSYLYIAESLIMKIVWIVVIFAMTALGIGFVVSNTNDYMNARIVTTIDSSSASLKVRTIRYVLKIVLTLK